MAATPKPQIVMLEGSRSSTPPNAEKVGSWILGWAREPPGRPPSAHNSEFDVPALDPDLYVPISMDKHHIIGDLRSVRSPVPIIARIPSPSRSNATAKLNEELNEQSSGVPDYAAVDEPHNQRPASRNTRRSEAAVSVAAKSPDRNKHLSYESWGNLGAPRESTFGPMVVPPDFARRPGETPAFAAGIPLPSRSQYTASVREPSIAAFPSVVPITVEAPSEPPFSRHSSHIHDTPKVADQAEESFAGDRQSEDSDHHQRHSRAASTAKEPSVAHSRHHKHEQKTPRAENRAMSPRSRVAATPSQHNFFMGLQSPKGVPLPVSEMGSVYNYSPSKVASHVGDRHSRAPSRKSVVSVADSAPSDTPSRRPEASHKSRAEDRFDDNDSLVTEHNPGSFRRASVHNGPHSRHSETPQKAEVTLHPLTGHTRPVGGSHRAPSSYANSVADDNMHHSHVSHVVPSVASHAYQRSHAPSPSPKPHSHHHHADVTPTHSRPQSPLNESERGIIDDLLLRTPRTSYTVAPSALAAEVHHSHFHDDELCLLLHAADDPDSHDVVKKVVRKAIKARLKKLGVQQEKEVTKRKASPAGRASHASQVKSQPSHHSQRAATPVKLDNEPPPWVHDMVTALHQSVEAMQDTVQKASARIDNIDNQLSVVMNTTPVKDLHQSDANKGSPSTVTQSLRQAKHSAIASQSGYRNGDAQSRRTLSTQRRDRSMSSDSESGAQEHLDEDSAHTPPHQDSDVIHDNAPRSRRDSPGQQYFEQELYKLKKRDAQSEHSHNTWEIARDDDAAGGLPASTRTETDALPEIPGTEIADEHDRRSSSPPLPAIPVTQNSHGVQLWDEWRPDSETPPPWQRLHQRLLNWAIVWPMSELDQALNSTLRDHQVNEVALSIWSTQTYKRYVRTKMMDHPRQTVDRLFVPPNMADAINTAVFNGRHGDACGMLRDLWHPFGLEGMPRLLIVLARHRKDQNHWVVHRFSLPDGGLTTYDSYPERALPDGRPLGWWFAIRIAWPHAMYPSPDHLVQKIVRLHRPLQLLVDNSVAAAGVWRNILMGSRAERTLDLERLRDLINTEVKNLRQRKEMGKLTVAQSKPNWEDMPVA